MAGPYSDHSGDAANPYDAPIPGFVGPGGDGNALAPPNVVNPVFTGWASTVVDYSPAPGVYEVDPYTGETWQQPARALGAVTGNHLDVVSLGDLYDPDNPPAGVDPQDPDDAYGFVGIDAPGSITVGFDRPIRNGAGFDLAVFENGLALAEQWMMADLGYVEVSSDGEHFARLPSRSLTASPVPTNDALNPTDVHNLAGKHRNSYGWSWGTPIDLADVAGDPLVLAGQVDPNLVRFLRIVDIPGSGDFVDSQGGAIYDAWVTWSSGGFDLEAVGAINRVGDGDLDGDGAVSFLEAATAVANIGRTDASWSDGDFDGDGAVTVSDAELAVDAWTPSPPAAPSAVPEPGSIVLLGAAAAGLAFRRRRAGRR